MKKKRWIFPILSIIVSVPFFWLDFVKSLASESGGLNIVALFFAIMAAALMTTTSIISANTSSNNIKNWKHVWRTNNRNYLYLLFLMLLFYLYIILLVLIIFYKAMYIENNSHVVCHSFVLDWLSSVLSFCIVITFCLSLAIPRVILKSKSIALNEEIRRARN